jgi:hypothetical protein
MLLSLPLFIAGLAATGAPAVARDGFRAVPGFRGVAPRAPRFVGRRLRDFRRIRSAVPLFLDGGAQTGVTVIVQQNFGGPAPAQAAFADPGIFDLPVSLGIREAPPAQAAVYVLNENGGIRRETVAQRRQATFGAKVIEVPTGDGVADVDASFSLAADHTSGARIIHLAVPVGLAN